MDHEKGNPQGHRRTAYRFDYGRRTKAACKRTQKIHGSAGGWVEQSIGDVVAGGRDKARSLLSRYCTCAAIEDTGLWTNRIALYLGGGAGDRLTVYVDDLALHGKVPDAEAYLASATKAWERYRKGMQSETARLTNAIAAYREPVAYPPDADLLARIKKRAVTIADEVDSRGFPKPATYNKLVRYVKEFEYLSDRIAWLKAHPAEGFIPYTRNPVADEKILPDALIHRQPSRVVKLRACPGEYEPTSIIVHARKALKDVSIEVDDFVTGDGDRFSAERADVRLVKCWYKAGEGNLVQQHKRILTPELLVKDDRLIEVDRVAKTNRLRVDLAGEETYIDISDPDADFPEQTVFEDAAQMKPFDVPQYENRELWVTVHLPEDTSPGTYRSRVTVAPANCPSQSFSISVRVLPFVLPQRAIDHRLSYRGQIVEGATGSSAARTELWSKGYDGTLNYAYQHGMGRLWHDLDHKRRRDHVFAYPTSNGAIDTVQWECYREAIDDHRYLAVLLKSGGRSKAEIRRWLNDFVNAGIPSEKIRNSIIAAILAQLKR